MYISNLVYNVVLIYVKCMKIYDNGMLKMLNVSIFELRFLKIVLLLLVN